MNNGYGIQPNNGFTNQRSSEILTIDLVSGESAVYSFYVAPGVTAFLLDFNSKRFYIKAVDFRGVPQQIRVFSFDEIIQQPVSTGGEQNNNALQLQIDELKQMILAMGQNTTPQNQPKEQKRGNNR